MPPVLAPVDDTSRKSSDLVLLAEDNENDIVLFKRAFKQAAIKCPLRVVRDGEEVIKYLKGTGKFSNRNEHPFPKLLLLDLKMPGKDGFAVLAWIRQEPSVKHLRVVVLTTSGELQAVNRAYELGANSFIVKSANTQEFVAQLRDIKRHWL